MPDEEPITGWIGGLKSGDNDAARKIWQHYSPRVVALAETRLPVWLRRIVDGEDIASSALRTVIMDLQAGAFPDLKNRDDLWALLACITVRKSINQIKSARCKKRPPLEAAVPLDEDLIDIQRNDDLATTAAEQFELLLDCLHRRDELLEAIALWKFEGYTNTEIARRIGCSGRRVARKLDLIRMAWQMEALP